MKNLANCKPSEFLKQANKIRKSVERWLKVTDVMQIRKTRPDIPEDATEEERKAAYQEQARVNMNAMLDAILDEHPDETLELLALVCFVDPEHVDDYDVAEYLKAINEIIGSEAVLGFFGSLARLGQTNSL